MKYLKELLSSKKEDLVNKLYNRRLADYADFGDKDEDPHGYGKRLPYIGWFWRSADFVNKRISIGDCGEFIGVMENNKWDYPEREMTDSEATKFISMIEDMFEPMDNGGCYADMCKGRDKNAEEIWKWFQTLKI